MLSLLGQAAQAADSLEWLESAARETENVEMFVIAGHACATAYVSLGQGDRCTRLLAEMEAKPDVRQTLAYAGAIYWFVRSALAAGDQPLAERLVEGVEPNDPTQEDGLALANAALCEARGELRAAAEGYAAAAVRNA